MIVPDFSLQTKFFIINEIFFYKFRTSLEESFYCIHDSYILSDRLYKVKAKLKSTWFIMLLDYTNVTKSFEMTLNSEHGTEKLKTKEIETRKTKTQRDEDLVLQKNR